MTYEVRKRFTSPAAELLFAVNPLARLHTVRFDSGEDIVSITFDQFRQVITASQIRDPRKRIDIPILATNLNSPVKIRLFVIDGSLALQPAGRAAVDLSPVTGGITLHDFDLPPHVELRRLYGSDAFPDATTNVADEISHVSSKRNLVSVVIPNYEYAQYLDARLDSVFGQTLAPAEVIVLDDGSSDNSTVTALNFAMRTSSEIQLICGSPNSGNVFEQWRKAATLARSEYLWIAEADDISLPGFLSIMSAILEADRRMSFAFCDSFEVNRDGDTVQSSFKDYYASLGDDGLATNATFGHKEFMSRFLFPRNLVLNASAVLWRTQSLRDAFQRCGDEAMALTCAGDWRLYVEACQPGTTIGYSADTLNGFRRHDQSVTHRMRPVDHVAEIATILDLVIARAESELVSQTARDQHLATLSEIWGIK